MGETVDSKKEDTPTKMPPTWSKGNYRINWINTLVISLPLLLSLFGLATVEYHLKTFITMIVMYFITGFGITVGYHRLWSHRAFTAHPSVEWFLAVFGAGAYQGSAIWWCRNHRIHHRHIDTDKDPYNATRGFVYTHFGWMVMQQDYSILGRSDISDLKSKKCLQFQHKHYLPVAFTSGVLIPTMFCGLLWGDWMGGFYFASMCRIVMVHNSTFFVNSLAHSSLFGAEQTFSDGNSSHDSFVTAVLTLGEGYHNFHHEFPSDYRNGIRFYQYDPTKWIIRALAFAGLATNLSRAPQNEIDRDQIEMKMKTLKEKMSKLDLGPNTSSLEEYDWEYINKQCSKGAKWVVVDGYVLDVMKSLNIGKGLTHKDASVVWYDYHPGGAKMLDAYVGKDATAEFHGQLYKHSISAKRLAERLRIAKVQGWKEENH